MQMANFKVLGVTLLPSSPSVSLSTSPGVMCVCLCVRDVAVRGAGQSRLTRDTVRGAASVGVVGSERVMEVWECLLGPLTFVTEASYNPVLKRPYGHNREPMNGVKW